MRWEDAVVQAIKELSEAHPENKHLYLLLLIRAGQLTTDTSKCEHCGGGG